MTDFEVLRKHIFLTSAHVWPGELLLSTFLSSCPSQHRDRTIPVLIIGILVFLPGFYHLRIAYYASKGYRGYSYDDIPDFDDWAAGTGWSDSALNLVFQNCTATDVCHVKMTHILTFS